MNFAFMFLVVTIFISGILFFFNSDIENRINSYLFNRVTKSPSKSLAFYMGNRRGLKIRKVNHDFMEGVKILSFCYFAIACFVLCLLICHTKFTDPYIERTQHCAKIYDSVSERWV